MTTNTAVFRLARATRLTSWAAVPGVWPVLIVGFGYYVGCLAGFALRFPSSGISFFWPPTAVLTAALLLTERRSWTPLLAGSLVAHLIAHAQNGVPIAASPILFFGNASQALLAAVIVRRFLGDSTIFATLRNVVAFLVGACVVAPAIASITPAYAYVSLGWAPDFLEAWRARAVSNGVTMLTLVPSFITLWHVLAERRRTLPARSLEYALLLLGVAAVQLGMAEIDGPDILGLSLTLYAPAPFLVWATVRFGGPGLSFALAWTTLLTIEVVSVNPGFLAGTAPADTVTGMQLLIAAHAIPMMLIAGLLEQNRAKHAALVEVAQQNRAILRALPDSLYVLTRDGASVTMESFSASAAPDDVRAEGILSSELVESVCRMSRDLNQDATSVAEFTHPIGVDARRYEARLVPIEGNRVLAVVRDITEQWRAVNALQVARERYALATEAGGIGVWELDLSTRQVTIEGNLKALLGYSDAQLGNRLDDWATVIHKGDLEQVLASLAAVGTGQGSRFEKELRMLRSDGATRWMSSKGAVVEGPDGQPSSILGTYADITDRKEATRALAQANEALVRTGRIVAVAELSASIAHELHQPLAAIAANAQAGLLSLDGRGPIADVRDALNDVLGNTVRASDIVNRTQEMFANHPLRTSAMSLNDAVHQMLDMASARLRQSEIRVELRLQDGLPPILADAVQVHQVLLNLIVNATDAMAEVPHADRVLRIRTRRGRNAAIVSVRDCGVGFDTGDHRRLFEPFYTTKATGIGMGLAICRSIVTSHGGSLWAVRNVDRGTTFRFTLPFVPAEAPGQELTASRSRRVLVVDDHQELRSALARLLRTGGHEVALADEGLRALSLAQTFQPDAAIIDISLQGMSGLDVGRSLRKTFPIDRLQLIALTAHKDDDMRQACAAAGFDGYVVKPGLQELDRLLRRIH